ncbi:MAG: hypothetical protein JOZ29_00080 [Deltaproteobacteria bacterium]|nr:hypothetical protein [Deltaproteobacteria bacterium]
MANRRDGRRIIGSKELTGLPLLLIFAALCCASEAYAGDLKSASAHFADQSFALLDRLSKHGSDNANPLLGLVASFSGDADSLRQSLAGGDLRSASSNIASLQADSTAVDQALQLHPNAIAAEEWNELRQQVAKLASEIPACGAHSDCGPAPDTASVAGSAPPGSISSTADSPRIEIISRESGGGIVRLKGYFEGTALKSAGIYEGAQLVKAFNVNRVPSRQRVDFDLRLKNPDAATILRIADTDDRIAEAPVIDPSLQPPRLPPASEISAGEAPPVALMDEGEMPRRPDDNGGVAEIPSHGPLMPSPSKRHTMGSKLGDVRINLLGVTRTRNLPPTYEIVGEISGRGITRAGIYLDGRMLQPISITDSANYTDFDQWIVAPGGAMTIRAYSVGNQYIEQAVDLSGADDTSELTEYRGGALVTPMPGAGIAVQITEIRPLAGNLYAISGIISGPGIVSAGLYQNGVLTQNIGVASGLAGALGALIPGSSRSINFNVRFNPYAGPAFIRAFNSTGAYTEQPVVVAGISSPGTLWPNSPYSGRGNLPFEGGASASPYGNRLGSTRPFW